MRVTLNIKEHKDRITLLQLLQANGYKVKIVKATEYIEPRVYVEIEVGRNEVKE